MGKGFIKKVHLSTEKSLNFRFMIFTKKITIFLVPEELMKIEK